MKKDKISIIVPVYNTEEFVEKCINSICRQTYDNLEIILVDDGSTDHTLQILQEMSKTDQRIVVLHQNNQGVTSARLNGVKVATGDWIGFVDGDDYIEPGLYELLLNNAKRYDAEISHCGYQKDYPERTDYYYNTGQIVEQSRETGVYDLLKGDFVEPGLWNKLFKYDVIEKSGVMDRIDYSITINEDLLMNYYLFSCAKKSVYEDRCYYHYIVRETSATHSQITAKKLKDPMKVLVKLIAETENYPQWQKIVKERYIYQLIQLATNNYYGDYKLKKQFKNRAQTDLRKHLVGIMTGDYSLRIKALALGAVISPAAYSKAHALYKW